MPRLTTVKVQYESKIKIYGQNLLYGEDLRSLTLKTKKWGNNHLSRRFGKYSFDKTQNHDLFISPKRKNAVLEMALKSFNVSKLHYQMSKC